MPYTDYTTKILGFEDTIILKVDERENRIDVYLEMQKLAHTCPACGAETTSVHDYRWQAAKDLKISGKSMVLHIHKRRYVCKQCGKRFQEKNPYLRRYQRVTTRLMTHVISSLAEMRTIKDVAKEHDISPTTAARYFSLVKYSCSSLPEVLSIDEFKGDAGGQKYQCIITDARKHRVLDILPTRKQDYLLRYFGSFSTRNSVKYVVMDMSRSYLEIARTCFPKATIVIDKYHVVRQVHWAFENVRKAEQQKFSDHRRKYFKRSRKLLLTNPKFLKEDEVAQVTEMLKISPRLRDAYHLKNRFLEFMNSKDRVQAKERLTKWLLLAEVSNLPEFKSCLTAIHNWDQYILNAFDCGYTNGFTEGCNNKIKVLKRISYGVRNFSLFRNRILHMMNSKAA